MTASANVSDSDGAGAGKVNNAAANMSVSASGADENGSVGDGSKRWVAAVVVPLLLLCAVGIGIGLYRKKNHLPMNPFSKSQSKHNHDGNGGQPLHYVNPMHSAPSYDEPVALENTRLRQLPVDPNAPPLQTKASTNPFGPAPASAPDAVLNLSELQKPFARQKSVIVSGGGTCTFEVPMEEDATPAPALVASQGSIFSVPQFYDDTQC